MGLMEPRTAALGGTMAGLQGAQRSAAPGEPFRSRLQFNILVTVPVSLPFLFPRLSLLLALAFPLAFQGGLVGRLSSCELLPRPLDLLLGGRKLIPRRR